jgi:alpha-glucosidase (family GH31 glycosyl hydrolase)
MLGNIPQVNAQFYSNSSTYKYYAYNARMFVSLAPYRRSILENESAAMGWPLLRPPVMYHVNDKRARQISYESFYLGGSLYVAPVLDPETSQVQVYFPGSADSCKYTHVWTGSKYIGGQEATIFAPYGKPAVFVVEGKEVPELQSFLDFVRSENGTKLTID